MPRYFFHAEDGVRCTDEDGLELPGPDAAKAAALKMLGEMLKGKAAEFWTSGSFRLTVTNDVGLILYHLDLSGVEAPAARQKVSWA